MISTWKKRRAARRAMKEIENGGIELAIPNHFRCPISLDLMKDPVTLSTGITYDRESIEKWIEGGRNVTCPITNQVLRTLEPIPNHTIRKMIQDWCVDNKSYGIERIPTPRIPISSIEVLEIQSKISSASKDNDQESCRNSVVKIKTKLKENERNKRTIVSNSTSTVLSSSFVDFSRNSSSWSQNAAVLEEILSCLTLMFPLDQESKNLLGSSTASMNCLVWFLKSGDLSARRNAVLVLKEVISSDSRKAENLSRIEGSSEALFKLIQEPICPTATKASLLTVYAMVTSNSQHIISRFVEMGVVSLLIEMLVDSEKSKCEKALAILDRICSSDTGREKAYQHSLTIPVLVKKIHRVSEIATEFSVAILWKLCKNEKKNNVAVEALQVGAFQKLLLLLQVGCGEKTKEKATELLKLLNPYREKLELECIDSADFKDLKRPF
ncbi:U-box domain-containing protein 21-like [Mercurialis annua]|uniref:U-box domain-containing protein 21-like n=1 Tax=Mercurialis annua TaxID=3986 RepID=UPI00215FE771|nr:U-box domain-containing protein 21-like [Mercurialis annua]